MLQIIKSNLAACLGNNEGEVIVNLMPAGLFLRSSLSAVAEVPKAPVLE